MAKVQIVGVGEHSADGLVTNVKHATFMPGTRAGQVAKLPSSIGRPDSYPERRPSRGRPCVVTPVPRPLPLGFTVYIPGRSGLRPVQGGQEHFKPESVLT